MTSLILVTGGTGTLGQQVVAHLRDAGGKVRVLSRRSHPPGDGVEYVAGDLLTGEGVGPAVDGAGVIVHCASGNKGDADATHNLVRAASSLAPTSSRFATSGPRLSASRSWPVPGCRGRCCAPPSSTT
jgi:uncharacterized protein YbjT (DUF2867 family)